MSESFSTYALLYPDGTESDGEYEDYCAAIRDAVKDGCEILERSYTYESEIVWTPGEPIPVYCVTGEE